MREDYQHIVDLTFGVLREAVQHAMHTEKDGWHVVEDILASMHASETRNIRYGSHFSHMLKRAGGRNDERESSGQIPVVALLVAYNRLRTSIRMFPPMYCFASCLANRAEVVLISNGRIFSSTAG